MGAGLMVGTEKALDHLLKSKPEAIEGGKAN
jgi:hypothetical protein